MAASGFEMVSPVFWIRRFASSLKSVWDCAGAGRASGSADSSPVCEEGCGRDVEEEEEVCDSVMAPLGSGVRDPELGKL